jgi:tetratricopeptide (TPR) repeat protein
VLPQQPKPILPHLVPAGAGAAPVASANVLDALVQDAGGTLFRVTSGAEAVQAARNVVDDLRHQYTLAYTPARAMDGTYRRLRIETTRPGLFVRHRLGYLAAPGERPTVPVATPEPLPGPAARVTTAANAGARPTSGYEAAVASFRATRDVATAQLILGTWTRAMLSDAAAAAARHDDPDFTRAAALFHLETALDGAPLSADDAMFHVTLGERALQRVAASREAAGAEFRPWYAASASVFLAQSDTARAREVAGRGLARVRGSAHLQFVSGRIEDVEAQRYDADLGRDDRSRLALNMERRGQLALAERAYRQALAVDPRHAPAQLHLGRVLALLDKTAEAQRLLAPVAAAADAAPGDRYLAALFLASLHERAGEVERARALLESIETFAPGRQTAWVALAQLEVRAGDVERARDAVRRGTVTTAGTDEWWEYRNGGMSEDEFEWLRARVSRSPR